MIHSGVIQNGRNEKGIVRGGRGDAGGVAGGVVAGGPAAGRADGPGGIDTVKHFPRRDRRQSPGPVTFLNKQTTEADSLC